MNVSVDFVIEKLHLKMNHFSVFFTTNPTKSIKNELIGNLYCYSIYMELYAPGKTSPLVSAFSESSSFLDLRVRLL